MSMYVESLAHSRDLGMVSLPISARPQATHSLPFSLPFCVEIPV